MSSTPAPTPFSAEHAARYDQTFAHAITVREALNLIIGTALGNLPHSARLLCVGAGTGAELIPLAERFPGWRFIAVDPSGPMLAVCRSRIESRGLATRCQFHEGYLDSLPEGEPSDAATSVLVSQFLLSSEARVEYFRAIASRLRPRGVLITADLCADLHSPTGRSQFELWLQLLSAEPVPTQQVETARARYERDVAVLPPASVSDLIVQAGFETPVPIYQAGLLHAWRARRAE